MFNLNLSSSPSLFGGGCSSQVFRQNFAKSAIEFMRLDPFLGGFRWFFDPDFFGILPNPPANLREDDEATNLRISSADMGGEKKRQLPGNSLRPFWNVLVTRTQRLLATLQSEDQKRSRGCYVSLPEGTTNIPRHPTLSQVGDKSIFVHKSGFCILAEVPISFRVFIPQDALVKLVGALMGETKGKIT